MVCSRGTSPHTSHQPMQLFTAIASAAVIGASFFVLNPVEARNGWVYVGKNMQGTRSYVRVLGRQGDMVKYESRLIKSDGSGMNDHMLVMADCKNQRIKLLEGVRSGKKVSVPSKLNSWNDVMQRTALLDDFNSVCS